VAPFFIVAPTSVHENGNTVPQSSALIGNYPNPFSISGDPSVRGGRNSSTMIKYEVAQPMEVMIEIFDLMGRKIRTLVKAQQSPGNYGIAWDGRNDNGQLVPSGIYIYQLRADDFTQSMKMVFIR
jgi:flagellar hook assembly protein FlgD